MLTERWVGDKQNQHSVVSTSNFGYNAGAMERAVRKGALDEPVEVERV